MFLSTCTPRDFQKVAITRVPRETMCQGVHAMCAHRGPVEFKVKVGSKAARKLCAGCVLQIQRRQEALTGNITAAPEA